MGVEGGGCGGLVLLIPFFGLFELVATPSPQAKREDLCGCLSCHLVSARVRTILFFACHSTKLEMQVRNMKTFS